LGVPQEQPRVERSLYTRAVGFSYDAVKIFMPAIGHNHGFFGVCRHKDLHGFIAMAVGALIERTLNATSNDAPMTIRNSFRNLWSQQTATSGSFHALSVLYSYDAVKIFMAVPRVVGSRARARAAGCRASAADRGS
jgi:hypothetical protein